MVSSAFFSSVCLFGAEIVFQHQQPLAVVLATAATAGSPCLRPCGNAPSWFPWKHSILLLVADEVCHAKLCTKLKQEGNNPSPI